MNKSTVHTIRKVHNDIEHVDKIGRKRAKKGEKHKQAVSIRLSPEVIAFFKSRGDGWQTRIDHLLMAVVEASR